MHRFTRGGVAALVLLLAGCSSADAETASTLRRSTTTEDRPAVTVQRRTEATTTVPGEAPPEPQVETTTSTAPTPPPPPPVPAPAAPATAPPPVPPQPPAPVAPPAPPPVVAPAGSVESIVRAAAAEFGVSGDLMVRIARCESGLNPSAVNASSGALGLFQHLPSLWGARAAGLGYGYESWSDPTANARVSAVLLRDGGPGHWRACL